MLRGFKFNILSKYKKMEGFIPPKLSGIKNSWKYEKD